MSRLTVLDELIISFIIWVYIYENNIDLVAYPTTINKKCHSLL
jgi:hypothetical protein